MTMMVMVVVIVKQKGMKLRVGTSTVRSSLLSFPFPACLAACLTLGCSLTISGSLGQCLTPPFWSQCSAQHYARTRQCSKPLPPLTLPHSHKPCCEPRRNSIGFCSVRSFRCSVPEALIAQRLLISITLAASTGLLNSVPLFPSFFLNIETLFYGFLKGLFFHPWEISSFLVVEGNFRRGPGQKWGFKSPPIPTQILNGRWRGLAFFWGRWKGLRREKPARGKWEGLNWEGWGR